MHAARLASETDPDGWRDAARALLMEGARPEDVVWRVGDSEGGLFDGLSAPRPRAARPAAAITASRKFLDAARLALCHREPSRFDLLYRLLWRLQTDRVLLSRAVDDDVIALHALTKAVRRDIHKMHAFVRFRALKGEDNAFVAWFEPEHRIVEAATPFFKRRFATMRWSILTPDRCAHWDMQALTFTEGAQRAQAPDGDALEDLWRGYYRSIFNPARLKVKAMTSEMPKKYWKNLPEAELIAPLIASAQAAQARMVDAAPTTPKREAAYAFPEAAPAADDALTRLKREATACELCDHARHATQVVFGEGPPDAALMIVGEQPGDREDIAGRPFIGPAGEVLDEALEEADIARESVYLTNAVKHFRFRPVGKKRLHQPPLVGHIDHCRWWLERERALIRPRLTLAMGATAVRALHGAPLDLATARREAFSCFDGGKALACLHPASVLRLKENDARRAAFRSLVDDLRMAAAMVSAPLQDDAAQTFRG